MSVVDGIILTGIGILTVFAVLFALSICIRLISFTVHLELPFKKHVKFSLSERENLQLSANPNTSCRLYKQYGVDDQTAAMVMAIVAEEMKLPLHKITFISIQEVASQEENHI